MRRSNEVGHLNHGYTYSGHSVATSYSYFTRSDCLTQAYPKR
ncbi:UNVERIFIED_ORG: adenosylmethionine-8-amino-7-oxononanoate aminotransferase [Rhizobium etli]